MNTKNITSASNDITVSNRLSLQNFFIIISIYYSLNTIAFFINLVLKPDSMSVFLAIEICLLILSLFLAFFYIYIGRDLKKNGNETNYKLLKVWGYNILFSKIITVIITMIFNNYFELVIQSTIWITVISISINLLYTGFIMKSNGLKFLSALLLFTPILIKFLPDSSVLTVNNSPIRYYMSPIYISLIGTAISIYLAYKLHNNFEKNKQ